MCPGGSEVRFLSRETGLSRLDDLLAGILGEVGLAHGRDVILVAEEDLDVLQGDAISNRS